MPLHPTSRRSILILYSHLRLGLPNGLFPSGSTTKTLYTPLLSPVYATCLAHPTFLNFIIRTILGENYRSLSSTLCNIFHSPVISSLLGPNILLSTLFWNTLRLLSPSMWATKFHTHTKPPAKDLSLIRVNLSIKFPTFPSWPPCFIVRQSACGCFPDLHTAARIVEWQVTSSENVCVWSLLRLMT